MIHIQDSVVLEELLNHIAEQRLRAKLTDAPFDLGVVTNKRPSQLLELINKNEKLLKEVGMASRTWHADALRSSLKIGGEELFVSVCRPR